MRKTISLLVTLGLIVSVMLAAVPAYAYAVNSIDYSIEFKNDTLLENATLVSSSNSYNAGRVTTTKTYTLDDGTVVVDTLERNSNILRLLSSSDEVTRSRSITDYGTVSLSANFSWWTEGMFAYAECTSASASRSLVSNINVEGWNVSTSDSGAIGQAEAELYYGFIKANNPYAYVTGTLWIRCTDTGNISSNGNV